MVQKYKMPLSNMQYCSASGLELLPNSVAVCHESLI